MMHYIAGSEMRGVQEEDSNLKEGKGTEVVKLSLEFEARWDDMVAQLVERQTQDPKDEGSIP